MEEDDLDDILRGASAPSESKTESKKVDDDTQQQQQHSKPTIAEPEGPPTPYLTPDETKMVEAVFNLLLVLLHDGEYDNTASSRSNMNDISRSKRRERARTVMSHDLCRYIVDCALYTLPPPGVEYVSAVPTSKLQLKALDTMAVLGSLGDTIVSKEEGERKGGKDSSEKDPDDAAAQLRWDRAASGACRPRRLSPRSGTAVDAGSAR